MLNVKISANTNEGKDETYRAYEDRTSFGNHAFVRYDTTSLIYDACAGPAIGTDNLSNYYDKYHDDSVPAEDGRYTENETVDITDFKLKTVE